MNELEEKAQYEQDLREAFQAGISATIEGDDWNLTMDEREDKFIKEKLKGGDNG